jgi:hypothetical protein
VTLRGVCDIVKERTAAAQEMLEKYGILIVDYGFMLMEDDLGICIGISERFPQGVFIALRSSWPWRIGGSAERHGGGGGKPSRVHFSLELRYSCHSFVYRCIGQSKDIFNKLSKVRILTMLCSPPPLAISWSLPSPQPRDESIQLWNGYPSFR